MYKSITWFLMGYMFHKNVTPILADVIVKLPSKYEDLKNSRPEDRNEEIVFEIDLSPSGRVLTSSSLLLLQEVRDQLRAALRMHGHVTLRDLKELVGEEFAHEDESVVWFELTSAEIKDNHPRAGMFTLKLPAPAER